MKTLVIFRRPEIWVLILVVVALAVYAFRNDELPEIVETESPEPVKVLPVKKPVENKESPEAEERGLAVEKVEVDKGQKGWVVDLTLLGRSVTDFEAPVTEETLTAQTGDGDPVNHFFEPFKEEQSLLPDQDSLVTVRLWLEKPTDSISLDFQGRTVKTELPR